MSELRLPLSMQMSADPDVDREATSWGALVVDTLERWARGGIGSDKIANG